MNFWGAISERQAVFVVYAFVDNTDLIKTTKFPSDRIEDVVDNTQRALNF